MAGDYHKDLAAWIPHLIAVWRRARSKKGAARSDRRPGFEPPPDDALTAHEVKEVAAGVKRLSHGLTRERELAGARYMDDPALLGAYLLFYWPVSYAQAREALGELPHRPGSVLDLGSGPGPLAFACLDAGARDVTAAERSKSALELAKQLAVEAATGLSTREWSAEQSVPEGSFELVTMGHLLNELYGDPSNPKTLEKRAALVEQALARLKPNGTVLILEPALRDTSRALLQVRDLLVARGYAVRAPCMWRGNCPALVRESDWCHAERTWKPPALVEELARAAALHKEALKMSYLALAPKGEAWPALPEGRLFRIVSEPLEGKGRVRYMACGPEGRVGLALQERHSNANTEVFFKLRRGDVVRIDGTEAKGDGLGLADTSSITRIAWAGQPLKG
jgi:ribosomal protein RSM22 (predicted rRNA methylase)